MAIPVEQFQPENFEQANPAIAGISAGQNMALQNLANQLKANALRQEEIKSQFEPKNLQADLTNRLLKNAFQRIQNKYEPQNMQSLLEQRGAQTDLLKQRTKFAPLDELMKAENMRRMNQRFGPAFELNRILQQLPPAVKAAWISDNQPAYSKMATDIANAIYDKSLITPEILKKYLPNMNIPTQQPEAQQLSNSLAGGYQFKEPSPEEIARQRYAGQLSANQALTTNKTRTQMEGAIQVEQMFNDPRFQNQIQNASKYAGALGKGKAAADSLKTSNPQSYSDYLTVRYVQLPFLLNRIKTLEGMGATDKQREELHGLYDKAVDSLTSNPERFVRQINNLGQAIDNVGRSVQSSATPVYPVNRLSGIKSIGSEREISIPQFNTKAEFQNWYNGLSSSEKSAVKKQLGGQ